MRVRHVGLLIALVVLALLAAANWGIIVRPTELSLLVTRIEVPFGLVMLSVVGLMAFAYAVLLLTGERRLMNENAAQAHELATLRSQAVDNQRHQVQELEQALRGELVEVKTQLKQVLAALAELRSARSSPPTER